MNPLNCFNKLNWQAYGWTEMIYSISCVDEVVYIYGKIRFFYNYIELVFEITKQVKYLELYLLLISIMADFVVNKTSISEMAMRV